MVFQWSPLIATAACFHAYLCVVCRVKKPPGRKGPSAFFSEAHVAVGRWCHLQLSQGSWFLSARHPPQFSSPFCQSIARRVTWLVG